jgi:hypothetical protein
LLAGEAGLPCTGQVGLQQAQLLGLSAPAQGVFKLVLLVEVILDDTLVPASYENEVLDAGLACLIYRQLDHRPVDNRQHFLRYRLGGGQETGAETGDGKYSFLDPGSHRVVGLLSV